MAKRKIKRRNSEKRKEKSRDAARSRRTKECEVFNDLLDQLPLPLSQSSQMDKASVIRLAISHLKLRKLLGNTDLNYEQNDLQKKLSAQYPKAMDGFLLLITRDGDILFISESVSKYLGIIQVELIGQSIYDFTHPCDHDEIREILSEKMGSSKSMDNMCSFLMRMKCTLTSKGRSINLKSASYKVIRCSGHYVSALNAKQQFVGLLEDPHFSCLMLIAEPIPHPSNIEVPLDGCTFVSRHSLDMKFAYCDERVKSLLGYSSENLNNKSVFDYHHAMDSEAIRNAYKDLFSKGQAFISSYRFLAYGGGYCRVQTEATVINNQRTEKPQCVVCVNYVISDVEDRDVILSAVQEPQCPILESGEILSTESIFAPGPRVHSTPTENDQLDMLHITGPDGKDQILTDLMELAPSAGPIMTDVPICSYNSESSDCQSVPPGSPHLTSDMTILDLSYLNQNDKIFSNERKQENLSPNKNMNMASPRSTEYLIDELNFNLRAPYIPMDGFDDQVFSNNYVPVQDNEMRHRYMLGTTESVFEQLPDETVKENQHHKTPFSALRLEAIQNSDSVQGGEISRSAGPPKMKRPMETNRLETGPPVKIRCMEKMKNSQVPSNLGIITNKEGPQIGSKNLLNIPDLRDLFNDPPEKKGSSVLMNLLTTGTDTNHGYSIKAMPNAFNSLITGNAVRLSDLLPSSSDEEDYDYEDNFDDDSEDDLDMESNTGSEPIQKVVYSQPSTSVVKSDQMAMVTIPGSTKQPANLVVIRTSKGLLFAPISGQTPGSVVSIKY